MSKRWIKVASFGNEWSGRTISIDPEAEKVRVYDFKCTHWGYHDESEWDESEQFFSIENALAWLYPDAEAISSILCNTKRDYSDILRQLAKKNGEDPSLFVPIRKQDLFPDTLNAKPYAIMLYENINGWHDETHMVSIDESKGICWAEFSSAHTNNSHGTDVDYTYECTSEMAPDIMADYIQKRYSPETVEKLGRYAGKYYTEDAMACVAKLQTSGKTWQTIAKAGQKVIWDWLPDFTVQKLLYAAGNTAVFAAKQANSQKCVIKLNCVSKAKLTVEGIAAQIPSYVKIPGTVPIIKLTRLPLTEEEDILATIMPELEPIQKIKQRDTTTFGFIGLHHRDNRSGVDDRQVIPIALNVARSLKEIHKRGYVHNDVKPENILGKKEADQVTWCLGDFSSLRLVADQYQGTVHGTLAYMSPELRDRRPFSYSSDVYSWGITMLALCANRVPDGVQEVKVNTSRSHCLPEIVIRFREILQKALQPEPSQRFADGGALVAALEAMELDEQTFATAMKREREDAQVVPPATPDPVKTTSTVAPKPVLPEQGNKNQGQPSMEPFVGSLYNRLDQAGKLKLYVIMQNAINEMHNSGIIAGLNAELQKRVHDPDPEVRVREKTAIAKTVGKSCVVQSSPMPQNGTLAFLTVVKYNPKFVNSICLCIQGGIEGLYLAGIHKSCGGKLTYNVRIEHDPGVSVEPLEKLLRDLNSLYAEYQISILHGDAIFSQQSVAPTKEEIKPKDTASEDENKKSKVGFWTKLFGKKQA